MSIASTYDERVTVQRKQSLSARGGVTSGEVLDETGGPLSIRCSIDRRQARSRTLDGSEFRADATMLYAQNPELELKAHDLIVDGRGVTYRVADIEEASLLGFGSFFRAFLKKTNEPVPEPQHIPGDE